MLRGSKRNGSWSVCLAVGALAAAALWGGTSAAQAKKSDSCSNNFTVTTGGRTLSGQRDFVIPAPQVGDTIRIRGRFVRFTVVASTFEARRYTLTGANSPDPDKNLPINTPTVVFASKAPQHGAVLNSALAVRLQDEAVVLERSGQGQDMKIQTKNCAQGGIFQMEPEPGTVEVNVLGPDYRFTRESPDGSLCMTHVDGRFAAFDSPQEATLLANTVSRSRWRVAAGGRVGFVVGEDAVEGGCPPQRIR